MNDLELLTTEEVCRLLKVSERTVRNMMRDGRLPPVKLGKRAVRIRRRDVERLIVQEGA